MIPTRNDDDGPDVIDLTTSYGYYGSLNFPIRPPTPFADKPIWPQMLPQYNEDNDINGIVTWSLPAKQENFNYKTDNSENAALCSSHTSSLSSRANSTWRRTLGKLLKRKKSNESKKAVPSPTTDITYPYDFGIGEITQINSSSSRNTGKRVHWIDDDEIILNACHRFVEYLKLFVQNIINDKNEDDYLKNCHITLDELDSLIDCQQIKEAFDDIIEFAKNRDKNQLLKQQTYIENLISRTILYSSA